VLARAADGERPELTQAKAFTGASK
jgi:hypothetical protein